MINRKPYTLVIMLGPGYVGDIVHEHFAHRSSALRRFKQLLRTHRLDCVMLKGEGMAAPLTLK